VRAAVLQRFNEPLEVTELPAPQPGDGEVLVRVRATGLCGTDLKLVSGALASIRPPVIPGHEVAGEVVAGSDGLADGQRVAAYMYETCGQCRTCRLGHTTVCPNLVRIGLERDGGLAEYMRLRRENALPIDESVPFAAAAVSMDSVLTPWCALRRRAQLQAGEDLVVVGAGGLGLNAVQIARTLGARVAVVEPQAGHRARARELGAELTVAPEDLEGVRAWADGGADVALDSSGASSGFRAALGAVRRGGRVVCCGYQVGVDYAFESSRLVLEEITLLGARVGTREDARDVLRAVENGSIRPVIMDAIPLEGVNEALDRLRAGEVLGRLVVDMDR
jgi:D-arabinose 1-dehydrogenase-like Zn-dependent alcohol dehydrogenase